MSPQKEGTSGDQQGDNPYAPPMEVAAVVVAEPISQWDERYPGYRKRVRAIRGIAYCGLVSGFLAILLSGQAMWGAFRHGRIMTASTLVSGLIGIIFVVVGFGLWRWWAWARWAAVFCTVGVLLSQLGTGVKFLFEIGLDTLIGGLLLSSAVVSARILFLLLTPPTEVILSAAFRDALRQMLHLPDTDDGTTRTSYWGILLLLLILAATIVSIFFL